MGKALLVVMVLAGCVEGDDLEPPMAPTTMEVPAVGYRTCDLQAPFGTPTRVDVLASSSSDFGAQLTMDELTIFFSSDRGKLNGQDLYTATRASKLEPFEHVRRIDELATTGDDRDPAPSISGTTLYFWRNGEVLNAAMDRYDHTYKGVEPEAAMAGLDAAWAPFIGRTGLYFARPGSIGFAPRLINGRYDVPTDVLTDVELDGNPVVDASELTLWFAGRDGQVWTARRADLAHRFDIVGPVTELGATGTTRPTWMSRDGCTLYLESDRGGDFDLYVATRN